MIANPLIIESVIIFIDLSTVELEGNIPKLNVLSVDDNNFSNVRNLSELSNLKKLYISGNRLTTIDGIDEIECKCLRYRA